MDPGYFGTQAMPNINRVLKHTEAIIKQSLSKLGGRLSFLIRAYGQIEHYKNPHAVIFTDSTGVHSLGYLTDRLSPRKHCAS